MIEKSPFMLEAIEAFRPFLSQSADLSGFCLVRCETRTKGCGMKSS